jgi:MFS family permease
VLVLAGCCIGVLSFGPRTSLGLFTEPLSAFRGWEREAFALAIALQNLCWGLGQPLAGALADRFGAGRVLGAGGLLYAAGLLLMSVSTSPLAFALTGGVLLGIGLAGASFAIVIAAFSRMLPEDRRSWAIGLATASGSLGQFLFAPIGQGFLSVYGPATALVLLAGFVLLVPLLAGALSGKGEVSLDALAPEGARAALGRAFRHPSYVLLTAGFFVCGFHIAFVATHLPAYLTDNGLDASLAAWSLGLIGLFNVVGAYGSGVLAGRRPKRLMLSSIYFGRAVVFAVFVAVPLSPASVLVFSALLGLLWLSTVPPTSGLVGVMFGTRHIGMLFGVVFLSHQVGAFFGAFLGGLVYTATGAYDLMWALSIALGVAAAVVHLPISERPAGSWPCRRERARGHRHGRGPARGGARLGLAVARQRRRLHAGRRLRRRAAAGLPAALSGDAVTAPMPPRPACRAPRRPAAPGGGPRRPSRRRH